MRIGAVGSWLLLSMAAACGGSTSSSSKGTGNGGSSDDSGPSGSSGTGGTSGTAGSSGGSGATSAMGGTGAAGSSSGGGAGTFATGGTCGKAADCYPNLDGTALQGGPIVCMDLLLPGGYCTHGCITDADCCAVPGECRINARQVCSPFESTGQMFCFVSCESVDIQWSGLDGTSYCQAYAHPSFGCRSMGGGTTNRFVCVPI